MSVARMLLAALVLVTTPPAATAQSGEALFRAGRYKESIAAHERMLQLRAPDAAAHAWQITRAFARLGNAKQASRWLAHARQLGFRDERAVALEPGLKALLAESGRNRSLLRVPTGCASICARSTTLPPLRT